MDFIFLLKMKNNIKLSYKIPQDVYWGWMFSNDESSEMVYINLTEWLESRNVSFPTLINGDYGYFQIENNLLKTPKEPMFKNVFPILFSSKSNFNSLKEETIDFLKKLDSKVEFLLVKSDGKWFVFPE